MASLQYNPKTRKARFFFRYERTQYNKTMTMENAGAADRLQGLIVETIQDLERGKLSIPDRADVVAFICSGGKVATKPKPVSDSFQAPPKPETVATIFDTYAATLTPGSKEANTIDTEATHARHFKRLIGADHRFDSLSVAVLQSYANKRAGEGVVRDTIHKELTTLRVVWGWALKRGHVAMPLAWKLNDLTLPKAIEKPPFQTWEKIEAKIARGGLTEAEKAGLWECLWLTGAETTECVAWVRDHATRPFLHPMIAFAAYTGARRSEMLRSERDDWDFEAGEVTICQKKSDKSKSFTRRTVEISQALEAVMRPWFANHPGGRWTIASEDGSPIGENHSTGYFRRLMRGGKWSVLHGWHTFRHSLASNMASAGMDQRYISEMLGHNTEEMERRYRHLLPRKRTSTLNALY